MILTHALVAASLLASSMFGSGEKTQTLERHVTTTPQQRIDILGFRGASLEVHTWDKNEVYIKVDVRISSSTDEYEKDYINNIKFTERSSSTVSTIEFHEPEFEQRSSGGFFKRLFSFNISFTKDLRAEIYVPASNALTIDPRYGSVSIEDLKGEVNVLGESNKLKFRSCANVHTVENNYGNITLQDCGGSLNLQSQSSTISIDQFDGTFAIQSDYSTINISKASKGGTVESQSGKHTLSDIAGNLTVKSNYSKIVVRNVQGFVDVKSTSGTITIDKAQGVRADAPYSQMDISSIDGKSGKRIEVENQSGKIELRDIVGDVFIQDQYSTISMDNVKGSVDLSSQSSTITAGKVSGDWKSKTEYSRISIAELGGSNLSITNSSGAVDVQMLAKPNSVAINNQYAGVNLKIAKGFAGSYKLKSKYGSISSNMGVDIDDLGGGQIASGSIGTGTGSLRIETESGNIKLSER